MGQLKEDQAVKSLPLIPLPPAAAPVSPYGPAQEDRFDRLMSGRIYGTSVRGLCGYKVRTNRADLTITLTSVPNPMSSQDCPISMDASPLAAKCSGEDAQNCDLGQGVTLSVIPTSKGDNGFKISMSSSVSVMYEYPREARLIFGGRKQGPKKKGLCEGLAQIVEERGVQACVDRGFEPESCQRDGPAATSLAKTQDGYVCAVVMTIDGRNGRGR